MELLEITVTDEIAPLLERMAAHNKRFLKSAAKSLGYFMQKEIKEEVKTGSPGGANFVERRLHKIRAALQGGSAAKQWYGKMLRAIGYQYDDGVLRIGWTSRTAATYGRKQEEGFETKVTAAVRKRYQAAGLRIGRDKKYLITPERPFFEPMAGVLQPQIAPYVEQKLFDYVEENVAFSKKARRKYKVYG
jgi:hypothetical protein